MHEKFSGVTRPQDQVTSPLSTLMMSTTQFTENMKEMTYEEYFIPTFVYLSSNIFLSEQYVSSFFLIGSYWLILFPAAWRLLSPEAHHRLLPLIESFIIQKHQKHTISEPFRDAFCETKFSYFRHSARVFNYITCNDIQYRHANLPQLLLEGFARCSPIPVFSATTYCHLTKDFGCGRFVSFLLSQYLQTVTIPQLRKQVGFLLLRIYELMDDPLRGVGVIQSVVVPQKHLSGVYYELMDDWKNAISSYGRVNIEPLQSWARSRANECRKNLRMWYMLAEQARTENNMELACESHAHLNNWM